MAKCPALVVLLDVETLCKREENLVFLLKMAYENEARVYFTYPNDQNVEIRDFLRKKISDTYFPIKNKFIFSPLEVNRPYLDEITLLFMAYLHTQDIEPSYFIDHNILSNIFGFENSESFTRV